MHGLAKKDHNKVTRSLKELTPLIKGHLLAGDNGYIAAGHELLEARRNFMAPNPIVLKTGEPRQNLLPDEAEAFGKWGQKEFNRSKGQLNAYMLMAKGLRKTAGGRPGSHQKSRARDSWEDLLNREFKAFDFDAYNAERDEARSERGLIEGLIAAIVQKGYWLLAKQMHPDTEHGSKEAMARLNVAYEELKERL